MSKYVIKAILMRIFNSQMCIRVSIHQDEHQHFFDLFRVNEFLCHIINNFRFCVKHDI